jgi:hypothetical protein
LTEGLIENPNLNVYYSHVAIPELRSLNIFDKQQSSQYTDRIKTFLCQLVHDLRFSVASLPDAHSHFTGDHSGNTTSKDDIIEYDESTINGIIHLEKSKGANIAKQVFFIFVKTLHELAHASIYKSGRLMMSTRVSVAKKNEFLSTPATHALSSEAGNAIER